jgi:uncharacterized damage-inducible protein DinB
MAGLYQDHFRMFALYNRWANKCIYEAAGKLPEVALAEDRGAFFKSVLGVFNHLLVGDRIWLGRLQGNSPVGYVLDETLFSALAPLATARAAHDARLIDHVFALEEAQFTEDLTYRNTAGPQTQQRHHILAHMFNHQAHHRGQAHDLLCQIGGREAVPVLDLLAYQRHVMPLDVA